MIDKPESWPMFPSVSWRHGPGEEAWQGMKSRRCLFLDLSACWKCVGIMKCLQPILHSILLLLFYFLFNNFTFWAMMSKNVHNSVQKPYRTNELLKKSWNLDMMDVITVTGSASLCAWGKRRNEETPYISLYLGVLLKAVLLVCMLYSSEWR